MSKKSSDKKESKALESAENSEDFRPEYHHGADLSPQSLSEFCGQQKVVSYLDHIIRSAKTRKAALGHILFSGPPGLGKTALSSLIANEMGTEMHTVMASAIQAPFDLARIFIALKPGDILFIDEIHGLDKRIGEVFYTAIQDFKLDLTADTSTPISPFTLAGATTAPGKIDLPLYERFKHRVELKRYKNDEIIPILKRSALKLGVKITDEAVEFMAPFCQGTPRTANALMEHVRDHYVNYKVSEIKPDDVKIVFNLVGVYEDGLSEKSLIYIKTLNNMSRPAGVAAIAKTMNENQSLVESVIEPWLVYRGYIELTKRGRIVTDKGRELLKRVNID